MEEQIEQYNPMLLSSETKLSSLEQQNFEDVLSCEGNVFQKMKKWLDKKISPYIHIRGIGGEEQTCSDVGGKKLGKEVGIKIKF